MRLIGKINRRSQFYWLFSLIFFRISIKRKKDLDKDKKVGIIERVEKLKVRWSRG